MIIGSKKVFVESLPSTSTYIASTVAEKGLPEGIIIYTSYQSSGRGQTGNKWESEKGKNLLFSTLLYPNTIPVADQFLISMAIPLGICDFLKRHLPGCRIKWPNDIYVNDDKIAGVLIEHSIMGDEIRHTIVGIGLNLNQEHFHSDAPNPISLKNLTSIQYDPEIELDHLCSDLDKRYNQLQSNGSAEIRDEYNKLLYRLNEWRNYQDASGIFTGRILSVAESGELKIQTEEGKVKEYTSSLRYM